MGQTLRDAVRASLESILEHLDDYSLKDLDDHIGMVAHEVSCAYEESDEYVPPGLPS